MASAPSRLRSFLVAVATIIFNVSMFWIVVCDASNTYHFVLMIWR